jgi:hypothetical protein
LAPDLLHPRSETLRAAKSARLVPIKVDDRSNSFAHRRNHSSILFGPVSSQNTQSRAQQIQQEFQQLGQDLKSGNLSAAQTDFVTLPSGLQQNNSGSTSQSSNPLVQDFTQLASDLKAGNLAAAQQDFTALQQSLNNASTAGAQGHHHHHASDSSGGNSIGSSIHQAFTQLGQALQAGILSNAQSAYTTLQQDFQLFTQNNPAPSQATSPPTSTAASTGISVQA